MKRPSPFRYLLLIFPLMLVVVLAYFVYNQMAKMAGVSPLQLPTLSIGPAVTEVPAEDFPAYQQWLDAAVERVRQTDPAMAMFHPKVNQVQIARDGTTALIWMESYDPGTGELLAREPELAVAKLNPSGQKGTVSEWDITLPYEDGYNNSLKDIPSSMLNEDEVLRYQKKYSEQKVTAKFGGYYLPWAGGTAKQLTWSVAHTSCADDACHYAFDFADGTMFPLLAAKGGVVFAANWTCTNGSTKCTNYLILQDNSTTPVSYQIYYHLANGSIPTTLRTKGARVNQGQFIGNVDDTGASTGHHLHFMVHTNSYGYWGQSVDITFKDVDINYDPVTKGGRPRLAYEADKYGGQGRTSYVSGNRPANAPNGTLTSPAVGATFTTNNLVVSGTATDDKGITKVQPIAYYDNSWHEVGNAVSTANFSIPIDMCKAGAEMPNGPIVFAVNLYDVEGNQSYGYVGFRGITKNFRCSGATTIQPACQPSADQVALFNQADYSGTCKVFGLGDVANRASMGTFNGNDVASVLVGSNVQMTIFARGSYAGRAETFVNSDPDLQDNLINVGAFNSFKVGVKGTPATTPMIISPTNGSILTTNDSFTLVWVNRGCADEFQATLASGTITRTSPWMQDQSWNPGGLPAGSYTWQVIGRNSENGSVSTPASATFTITESSASSENGITPPYMDTVEAGANGWTATGLWHQTTARASSPTHSWMYGETVDNVQQYATGSTGTLTSPAIQIPAGSYYLHFTYRYQTESSSRFWDQRFVQISKDGGPFVNIYQLTDDPSGYWLNSPALDLSAYSGSNIRIRFYFNVLDSYLNTGEGWYVDNIQMDQNGPAADCNESVTDGNPASARQVSLNNPISGDICPQGDMDYFKFTAEAGQSLTFDVDARTIGSALDPYLYLIDTDGKTVLAESDDEVAFVQKDSRLAYSFTTTGTYYLKLKAWDHPMVGGSGYFYTLRIFQDTIPPSATLIYPVNGTLLANSTVSFRANAEDAAGGSGVSHVVFFWHNHDWTLGQWVKVGEDWDGSDGWGVPFDATKEARGSAGAVYTQVFDGSGNWTAASSWNIGTDPSQAVPAVPSSSMLTLPAASDINTVLLQWSAVDTGAGITGFNIQVQTNGGAWADWNPPDGIKSTDRYAWFIGETGNTYGFRMRVVDAAGGKEAYPASAETSVVMKACTPGSDLFETDDLPENSRVITLDGTRQKHTFCNQNDVDWVSITPAAGENYFLNALPLTPAGAVVITLYDEMGNPVAEKFPARMGQPTTLRWTASGSGNFYVKLRNLNPLIAGDGVGYQFWADQGIKYYVPLVIP